MATNGILCKYLLSSCVAKVMSHIFLVLRIGVEHICTPMFSMTMIYKTNIPSSEILYLCIAWWGNMAGYMSYILVLDMGIPWRTPIYEIVYLNDNP